MPKASKILIHEYCKGCGICVAVCPKQVLETGDEYNEYELPYPVVVNLEECILCRLCEVNCPDFAIDVVEEEP